MSPPSPRVFASAILAALSFFAAHAAGAAMGESDARHLLARTGFGPTASEVRAYAKLSRDEAVAKILLESRTSAVTAAPAWTSETGPLRPTPVATATEEERKAFRQQ